MEKVKLSSLTLNSFSKLNSPNFNFDEVIVNERQEDAGRSESEILALTLDDETLIKNLQTLAPNLSPSEPSDPFPLPLTNNNNQTIMIEIARSLYLLNHPSIIMSQRGAIIEQLIQLIIIDHSFIQIILTQILNKLINNSFFEEEFKFTRAPIIFVNLMEKIFSDEQPENNYSHKYLDLLLQIILQMIEIECEKKSIVIMDEGLNENIHNINNLDNYQNHAWLQPLFILLEKIDLNTLQHTVCPFARRLGDVSRSNAARFMTARLWGRLAKRLNHQIIKDNILDSVIVLCQDTSAEVRMCMCRQFFDIAKQLGASDTVSKLLPELELLLRDEEMDVSCEALGSLISLLSLLPYQVRVGRIFPLIKSLDLFSNYNSSNDFSTININSNISNPLLSKKLLFMLGSLIPNMYNEAVSENENINNNINLNQSDCLSLISLYKNVSLHNNNLSYRRSCAFNLSALCEFLIIHFPQKLNEFILSLLTKFAKDDDMIVRKTMAAQLHIIVKLLYKYMPSKSIKWSKECVLLLVKDKSLDVAGALIDNINIILSIYYNCLYVSKDESLSANNSLFNEILRNLLIFESNIPIVSWRLRLNFYNRTVNFINLFPNDLNSLYDKLLPNLLNHMNGSGGSPLLVRVACSRVVALLTLRHPQAAKRAEIFHRLCRDFGNGRSCNSRLMFIEIAKSFFGLASRRWVKKNLCNPILSLCTDNVKTVRQAAVALCPTLRRTCSSVPIDSNAIDLIMKAVWTLTKDSDKQVKEAALRAVMLVESGTTGLTFSLIVDENYCKSCHIGTNNETEADRRLMEKEDRRREEAEDNLIKLEEESSGSGNNSSMSSPLTNKKTVFSNRKLSLPISFNDESSGSPGSANNKNAPLSKSPSLAPTSLALKKLNNISNNSNNSNSPGPLNHKNKHSPLSSSPNHSPSPLPDFSNNNTTTIINTSNNNRTNKKQVKNYSHSFELKSDSNSHNNLTDNIYLNESLAYSPRPSNSLSVGANGQEKKTIFPKLNNNNNYLPPSPPSNGISPLSMTVSSNNRLSPHSSGYNNNTSNCPSITKKSSEYGGSGHSGASGSISSRLSVSSSDSPNINSPLVLSPRKR